MTAADRIITPELGEPQQMSLAPLSDALDLEYLEAHRLLPLRLEDGRLVVAHAGLPDHEALEELGALFKARVEAVPMDEAELLSTVRRVYRRDGRTAAEMIAALGHPDGPSASGPPAHELDDQGTQPPVVRLVNLLLAEALHAGASDVHLVETPSGLRVRYRVDGMLYDVPSPPPELAPAVVSRLKIMAELDIAERRVPQDGRVRLRVAGRDLDVRVSTLPAIHGESVVFRLLDARRRNLTLESLGLAPDSLDKMRQFAARPQGVLLSTGPTGSGKTTTLYALLERVQTGREKIISVEDPVEYELPGVVQVPVRPHAGLTFPRALRSLLRHDPDVLLVGEMRDSETAEICVQAALTGHLVLSTLHTNDAVAALTRLVHLGVPEYLVASTVELLFAQRLVRRVCDQCAAAGSPGEAAVAVAARDGWRLEEVQRGRGCAACRETGYRGRTAIFEVLEMDDPLRELVLARADTGALRRYALSQGMRPLRADGWRQVAAGVTTPEEILRVTVA